MRKTSAGEDWHPGRPPIAGRTIQRGLPSASWHRSRCSIQSALHFPLISPPASAWFARAMLYWDEVGTIVPSSWVYHPERLGEHTLELVQRELVREVFPYDGKRPRSLVWFGCGGAVGARAGSSWSALPRASSWPASRWAVCHPDNSLCRSGNRRGIWIPATADPEAFRGLLAGLTPLSRGSARDRELSLRVGGERRAGELRATILERALPVPGEPPTPEQLERFKRQHGDRLPRLRRHLEERIDAALATRDEVLQFRAADRVIQEIDELVGDAEAYLSEAGMRRIRRWPFVRMLKCIPGASGPVGGFQETIESIEKGTRIESEPLAYFAFARVELKLDPRYGAQRRDPLVELFAA